MPSPERGDGALPMELCCSFTRVPRSLKISFSSVTPCSISRISSSRSVINDSLYWSSLSTTCSWSRRELSTNRGCSSSPSDSPLGFGARGREREREREREEGRERGREGGRGNVSKKSVKSHQSKS